MCDDGDLVDGDGCNVDCVPSGTLRWFLTGDVEGLDDKTYTAAIDPAGGLVATGYTQDALSSTNVWFRIQADADGSLISTHPSPSDPGMVLGTVFTLDQTIFGF